jgi:CO dehydrogenase/acetyl-CoA synthase delta subunit
MSEPTMDEVVGRVRAFLSVDEPHPFQEAFSAVHTLDVSDVAKLLAAYQSVRAENARLRERDEWAQREFKRWGESLKDEYEWAMRRARTSGENATK